jgi:hypothetical protein
MHCPWIEEGEVGGREGCVPRDEDGSVLSIFFSSWLRRPDLPLLKITLAPLPETRELHTPGGLFLPCKFQADLEGQAVERPTPSTTAQYQSSPQGWNTGFEAQTQTGHALKRPLLHPDHLQLQSPEGQADVPDI